MGWFDIVASVTQAAGDAVDGVVNVVVDTATDVVDGACDVATDVIDGVSDTATNWVGPVLAAPVTLVAGAANGFIDSVRKVGDGALALVRDAGSVISDLLRLDLVGVLNDIGDMAIDFGLLIVVDIVQVVPSMVRGVVEQFTRNALKVFVSTLINANFSGDRRVEIRNKIGLDSAGHFGLRLPAEYRVCFLDSAHTPLFRLHEAGEIDLFALAGLLSGSLNKGRTYVRTVNAQGGDDFLPANYAAIQSYLDSRGKTGRLRVYALSDTAVTDYLKVAARKCRKLGVELQWNGGSRYFHLLSSRRMEVVVPTESDGSFTNAHPLQLTDEQWQDLFRSSGARPGTSDDERTLLAIGALQFQTFENRMPFGLTLGRSGGGDFGDGGPASCPIPVTPGRTDSCCSGVELDDKGMPAGSASMHRDLWPAQGFRFVLAHEIGHWLGLCHFGHNGFQNLMWTPRGQKDGALSNFDWGLAHFLWSTEPEFTFDDAKNSWRFIVDQLQVLL